MSQQIIIDYWIEKARDDLSSARDNLSSGRLQNAVRDAYFSCFHALSSVLLKEGKTLKKHKEVRSALHRDYIRAEKIEVSWGKHYDWLLVTGRKQIIVHWYNLNLIRLERLLNRVRHLWIRWQVCWISRTKEKALMGLEGHFRPSTSAGTDYKKLNRKKAKLSIILTKEFQGGSG